MGRDALALENPDVEGRGIVDQPEAALRRDKLRDLGEMGPGVGRREDKTRRAEPERSDFGSERLCVVDDVVRAQFARPFARLRPRGGGYTVRSVNRRASWMAMKPTPPAPPTISTAGAAPGTGLRTSSRSNSISQAVIAVSGNAAA